MQAVYPQCAEHLVLLQVTDLLEKHMYSGVMECRDALSKAMLNTNTLLAIMDFSIAGAVDGISNFLMDDGN